MLILTGCISTSKTTKDGQPWLEDWVQIGTKVGVDAPNQLTLLDNKETLAAEGLYYATWVAGNSTPYKNSDGDTIDLYDAQLYFLTSETKSEEKAKSNCNTWLSAAKENYEVLTENTITLNGQSYTFITYTCDNKENPYSHGVSAFGVCDNTALCIELTCLENYTEDLEALLTNFLENCYFKAN
ncbi:MAG: hypothetical protein ACI4F9_03090 [Lachnospiraceae bacterium]